MSESTEIKVEQLPPHLQVAYRQAEADYASAEFKRRQHNNWLLLINFPLRVGVFMALDYVGLLDVLNPQDQPNSLMNTLILCVAITLIFFVARKIAAWVYSLFVLATCCIGLVTYPLYILAVGFVTLYAMQAVLPQLIQLPDNNWLGLLVGVIVTFLQIPEISQPAKPEIKFSVSDRDQLPPNTVQSTAVRRRSV